MPKLAKPILACAPGAIHPTRFEAGEEVPEWLVEIAKQAGCLEHKTKAMKSAPENKSNG